MGFVSKEILAALAIRLSLDSTELKSGISGANKELQNLNNKINKIAPSLAAVFTVRGIVNYTKEAVLLGSAIEGVRQGFNKIANENYLISLQRATSGTVTEIELMKKAVLANNFQIGLKNIPKFFEFATKRAKETGESVDYMVDSIVRGIGRRSALILDNVGISATALSEALKKSSTYAEAVGKIVDQAMSQYKGDWAKSAGQQIDSLNVKLQELKTNIGEALISFGYSTGILQKQSIQYQGQVMEIQALIGSLLNMTEGTEQYKNAIDELISTYPAFFSSLDREKTTHGDLSKALEETLKLYQQKIFITQFEEEVNKLNKANDKLIKRYVRERETVVRLTQGYVENTESLKERLRYIKKNLKQSIVFSGNEFNGVDVDQTLKFFQKYNTELNANNKKIKDLKESYSQMSVELFGFDIFVKQTTNDIEKEDGIIEALQKDIERVKKAFNEATNIKDLNKYANEYIRLNKQLQKYLDLLKETSSLGYINQTNKKIKELNNKLNETSSIIEAIDLKNKIKDLEQSIEQFKGFGSIKLDTNFDTQNIKDSLDGITDEIEEYWDKEANKEIKLKYYIKGDFVTEEIYEKSIAAAKELNSIIQGTFIDLISNMASDTVSDIFDAETILEPIGSMMIKLGEMAVAQGIAIQAIQESLLTLNGIPAIAAGLALIAIGSAVKQGAAEIASGSSSSTSSTSTVSTVDTYNTRKYGQRENAVEIYGSLKGSDIYLSNQRYSRKKNLTT